MQINMRKFETLKATIFLICGLHDQPNGHLLKLEEETTSNIQMSTFWYFAHTVKIYLTDIKYDVSLHSACYHHSFTAF